MTNNLFNIKDKAIHCTTKELALETLSILDSMGYKWTDGSSLLYSHFWEYSYSNTCYRIEANKEIVCTYVSALEPSYILKAEDFIRSYKNNSMKKGELRSGMSVMLRDGSKGLLVDVNGCLIIQYEDSCEEITNYSNDLTSTRPFANKRDFDIIAVYKCSCSTHIIRENLCLKDSLIWERKEPIEITMQEIADKFGISINDLKIKKD